MSESSDRAGALRARIRELRTRRLAMDSGWAFANEIVTLISTTTAFMLLGRELGDVGYGEYVSMFALAGPATAFTTAGVSLTIFEHAVRLEEDPRRVAQSCLTIATLIGLLATAVLVPVSRLTIPTVPVLIVVGFFIAELILAGWSLTSAALVQATRGFVAATKMRIGITSSRVAMLAVLAATDHLNLRVLAVTWVITLGALALVNTVVAGRGLDGRALRPGAFSWAHVRSTGLYSFGISAVNVQNDGDKVALTASGHLADAGRYGAGYRIVQLGLMPINAVASATHISFLDAGQDPQELVARARRYSMISCLYGLAVGSVIFVAAPLVPWALGSDFEGTETIIRALIPLLILKGIGTFAMNALLGLGRNRLRTTMLVSNAAFSIVLYALLVPPYSWQGAAIATAVAEGTLSVMAWTAVYRVKRSAHPTPEDTELAIVVEEAETIAGATS